MALIKIKQVDQLQTELDKIVIEGSIDSKDDSVLDAASVETSNQIVAASIDSKDDSVLLAASVETSNQIDAASIDSKDDSVLAAAEDYANGLEASMDVRVSTLEAAIMEDFDQITIRDTFGSLATSDAITSVDSGANDDTLTITLASGKEIQDPDGTNAKPGDLVDVYINGVHAPIDLVATTTAIIQTDPVGFGIDSGDMITIKYQVESRTTVTP